MTVVVFVFVAVAVAAADAAVVVNSINVVFTTDDFCSEWVDQDHANVAVVVVVTFIVVVVVVDDVFISWTWFIIKVETLPDVCEIWLKMIWSGWPQR